MGFISAGVLSLWIIYKDWNIRLKFVGFESILRELKEGWYIFTSIIAISLYTTSNTFILGLFTNNTIVGYYSAAEKIVKAIQGLWSPVPQVLYPYFASIFSTTQEKAKMRLKKVLKFVFFITLFLSMIGYLLAPYLTEILLGKQFNNSVILVQILIFTIFAIGVNNILGIQGLVAFGYGRSFRNIVSVFGLLHIFNLIILIKTLGYIGVAIAVVITEILIAIVEYIILLRRKLI